jgi:hypothetical protein
MAYRKDYNVGIDEEVSAQSKLNAAGLINSTLENLWSDCYSSMANGNLVKWNRKLDAIWNILGGDCKEGDKDDEKMEEINLKIYKTGTLNHKKTGFEGIRPEEATKMALQYLLLNKKSLFLRRLQNKQGKGTAYISEDEDDFD